MTKPLKNLRFVVMDETSNWSEDVQQRCSCDKGYRIFGVYLYDPNVETHICSFQGSYELFFIANVPEIGFKERVGDWDNEDLWEQIDEDMRNGEPHAPESYWDYNNTGEMARCYNVDSGFPCWEDWVELDQLTFNSHTEENRAQTQWWWDMKDAMNPNADWDNVVAKMLEEEKKSEAVEG